MKFTKLIVAIIAVAIAITAMPVLACQNGECGNHWVEPVTGSVINVTNNSPVLAEINGGALSIWQQGGDFTNTAIGALANVPADCGTCPGGVNVDVMNNANVTAVINIGSATVAGPLKIVNTAVGAAALGGAQQ